MKSKKLAALVLSAVVCSSTVTTYLPSSRVKADDTTSTLGQVKSYTTSRFAGADRFATSQSIATEFQKTENNGIILAFGLNFPDALSGSALSHKYKMPVLLVGSQPSDIDNAMKFVHTTVGKDKTIYILGGTAGISDSTVKGLLSGGYTNVKRLGGSDRYMTNSKIVDELAPASGTPVVIANGQNFPDALSISSIASAKGYPIILTSTDNLSSEASNKLRAINPSKVYVIGGTGSVSDANFSTIQSITGLSSDKVVRIGGKDRYDTSLKIAKYFNPDSSTVTFANGSNFPDALSGSALSAQKNAPLLLVNNSDVSAQKQYIDGAGFTKEIIYGGEGAVSKDTEGLLSKSYDPNRDTLNADTGSTKTDIEPNQALKVYSAKGFSSSDISSIAVTDSNGTKAEVTPSISSDGKTITLTPSATFTDDTGTIKIPKNAYKCNTTYTVSVPGVSSTLKFTTRDYVINPDISGLCEDYLSEGKNTNEMWGIPNAQSLWKAHASGSSFTLDTKYDGNGALCEEQPVQLNNNFNKFATVQNKNMYNLQVLLRQQCKQLASADSKYASYSIGFHQTPPNNLYNSTYASYWLLPDVTNVMSAPIRNFKIYNGGSQGYKVLIECNTMSTGLDKLALYEVLQGLFGTDYAQDIYNYIVTLQSTQNHKGATIGGITINYGGMGLELTY